MISKMATSAALGAVLLFAAPAAGTAQHAGHGNRPPEADTAKKAAPHKGHTPAAPKAKKPARPVTPADSAKKGTPKHGGHSGHPSAMMSGTGHAGHAATPVQESGHTGHAMGVSAAPARATEEDPGDGMQHEMFMAPLGGGWALMGMAQAFPLGRGARPSTAIRR